MTMLCNLLTTPRARHSLFLTSIHLELSFWTSAMIFCNSLPNALTLSLNSRSFIARFKICPMHRNLRASTLKPSPLAHYISRLKCFSIVSLFNALFDINQSSLSSISYSFKRSCIIGVRYSFLCSLNIFFISNVAIFILNSLLIQWSIIVIITL